MDEYVESPMEAEDVFPCKGCGEILEEGKAFELAGNRWHLNCFRCNTCGTLLDSDANLLLLGDGSLICNNCTYSCCACGEKIEELAILTGDQAFCATCFRCRNCKRKIENLRYARTSQGIFCMSCHESLMARRRKKSKAAAQAKREKENSPMVTEKSLPALPPNAIPPNAFSNDRVDPESDTPTELSPRPRPSYSQNEPSSRSSSRPARSPERTPEQSGREGSLSLPSRGYRNNRNSAMFSGAELTGNNNADDQGFFIPVALDPSPAPTATPRSTSDMLVDHNKKPKDKDYFSISKQAGGSEKKTDSQASTPHIAFQDKGRQPSVDYENAPPEKMRRKLSKSSRNDTNGVSRVSPPAVDERSHRVVNGKTDDFKLQEAPKSKKLMSRNNSVSNQFSEGPTSRSSIGSGRKEKDVIKDVPANLPVSESTQHINASDTMSTPRTSNDSHAQDDDEMRVNDSLAASTNNQTKPISRKELPITTNQIMTGPSSRSHTTDSKPNDTYMSPRAPPAPPVRQGAQDSAQATDEQKVSPKLPRWSAGGDFSMDEDMARILGTDENSSSILRRVSNAVRHGRTNSIEVGNNAARVGHSRSISETTRAATSPRWPKTPGKDDMVNGSNHNLTSPLSINASEDPALLKRRLRNSEQRVAELERQFTGEKDLKTLTLKLEEKRKTVSVLDTQTEIMIRQLEVLAGYVETAKETKKPIDLKELEESAFREFVQKLEKLKQSMSASLEQLHTERDELLEEKNQILADRDRARVEFEQLVSKNAQLADLNNDITQQIQGRFKTHSESRPTPNGLGIYNHSKGASNHSVSLDNASNQTGTAMITPDQDESVLEAGPTVVKIKKFNWKKGSKTVAQNIAKGVNRTVVAFQQPDRHQPGVAGESIGLPYNMTVAPVESPAPYNAQGQGRQPPPGFFGFKKTQNLPRNMASLNASTPNIVQPPDVLFGSELAERAEYERRQIPCVVTRCIEEVELRGMDTEGIYRKTGGSAQTKSLQEGFDKNENYDISDPDIDITAVTSVLKQYFRKLPTPLLTYDVYDRILETNSITNDADKCVHLQTVLSQLPHQHKNCLEFLMFHLSRVAGRERENLMTPKNLAVVFAPTIMRDTNIEREMTDMHAKNIAVQFIIENSHRIFS